MLKIRFFTNYKCKSKIICLFVILYLIQLNLASRLSPRFNICFEQCTAIGSSTCQRSSRILRWFLTEILRFCSRMIQGLSTKSRRHYVYRAEGVISGKVAYGSRILLNTDIPQTVDDSASRAISHLAPHRTISSAGRHFSSLLAPPFAPSLRVASLSQGR